MQQDFINPENLGTSNSTPAMDAWLAWRNEVFDPENGKVMLKGNDTITDTLTSPVESEVESVAEDQAVIDSYEFTEEDAIKKGFFKKLGNSLGTFSRELWWGKEQPWEQGNYLQWYFKEGGWKYGPNFERAKRFGAFALGGITQAADRGRALVFLLPATFDHTLTYATEHGFNSYETVAASGLAVGGVFAAWGYVVGKSFHKAMNEFPVTTEVVSKNHPAMVEVVSKAADGFPTKAELSEKEPSKPNEGYDVKSYETRKSVFGKIALAVTRGLKTGLLYGTTMQVGMAKVSDHSEESIERRTRVTTAEGAGALAVIAAGVSTLLVNDSFGMAEHVRDAITNKHNLAAASLLFIGLATVQNYFARRKEARMLKDTSNTLQSHVDELTLINSRKDT